MRCVPLSDLGWDVGLGWPFAVGLIALVLVGFGHAGARTHSRVLHRSGALGVRCAKDLL